MIEIEAVETVRRPPGADLLLTALPAAALPWSGGLLRPCFELRLAGGCTPPRDAFLLRGHSV